MRPSFRVRTLLWCLSIATFVGLAPGFSASWADEPEPSADTAAPAPLERETFRTAPVVLDGEVLFRVRGLTSWPAEERAAAIVTRLRSLAADRSVTSDKIVTGPTDTGIGISAPGHYLSTVTDADARQEGADREFVANFRAERMREAVRAWRAGREPGKLLRGVAIAVAATAVLGLALLMTRGLFRRARTSIEDWLRVRVASLHVKEFTIIPAGKAAVVFHRAVAGLHLAVLLLIFYIYLHLVLAQFPWTKAIARDLLSYLTDPLRSFGYAFLAYAPKLAFLVVLYLVTRAGLRLTRLFFASVEGGGVTLSGFESEWAGPTYKIARVVIVGFALVIAYPHLPLSGSPAFQGLSIFAGVALSFGASSAISNVVAGYSLIYRRAFKIGDVVRIGDDLGRAVELRALVTHLRTLKNEEIIIPNSKILNDHVTNYSTLAREEGLILHTEVGIGYETPWRQVESMLLQAADRTPGTKADPRPFVLLKRLGDFAVVYELNVYTDRPSEMARAYAALHRNILDAFNEYGVQIMTPAYEGDPDQPKIVPRDKWHEAPAPPAGSRPPVAEGGPVPKPRDGASG